MPTLTKKAKISIISSKGREINMYRLFSNSYWQEKNIPFQLEYRDPQLPFPMHNHNFHELVYVFDGNGTHITQQGNKELRSGDILSIRPEQTHGFKKIDKLRLMNILVYPHFLNERLSAVAQTVAYQSLFEQSLSKNQDEIVHFNLSKIQMFEIQALIDSMQHEIEQKTIGYQVQATSYFTQLLVLLMRSYEEKQIHTLSPEAMIINYVEKNFRSHLTVKELADKSGLSESSLLRAFKKVTGEPPLVHQNKLRMEAATDDLAHTKKSITQIALDVGFNDSNYFTRAFKKMHNMSPQEFRKCLKNHTITTE